MSKSPGNCDKARQKELDAVHAQTTMILARDGAQAALRSILKRGRKVTSDTKSGNPELLQDHKIVEAVIEARGPAAGIVTLVRLRGFPGQE